MKISYNWIKDFLKIDNPSQEVGKILTDLGLEVEGIEKFESLKGGLKGVVVAEVVECKKHQGADKLSVTKVNIGEGKIIQIVCGAPNVKVGQKVPVATIGTTLYDDKGNAFKIKKGKIRGEESLGMICAEDELGLGNSHDGIMVLDETLEPGTPCSKVFSVEEDEIFEIGLTPNRADAMSHFGVARDLRAGLIQKSIQKELITPSVNEFFVDNRTLKVDVSIDEVSDLVPRYCAVTISGVKVGESPMWLKNRLKSIGINPKNNVVDITNYVLHEFGQPLHAFDADKISEKQVHVRLAKEGEKIRTLDGVERDLTTKDIVISDKNAPMGIAGVMGGANSEITSTTTNIFLESAYFNPVSVRKTAKRLAISSDASFRFERGVDINNTKYCLLRAATLIKRIAGGYISCDMIDLYPKKIEDFQVFLTYDKIRDVVGQQLPQNTIKSILASLEMKVTNVTERGLGVQVPSYRVDVQRDIDIIEDILRVYGYNNISFEGKINATMSNRSRLDDYSLQKTVSRLLSDKGFYQTMNNSLTSVSYDGIVEDIDKNENVYIINPLSSDLSVMRRTMLFSGLESVEYNINHKQLDLKLYEWGKTYSKTGDTYREEKHLAIFVSGNQDEQSWNTPAKKSDFFTAKTALFVVLERLGVEDYRQKPTDNKTLADGISIYVKDKKIADVGVVRKSILKKMSIKQDVFYVDVLWDNLKENILEKVTYREICKYPEVRRDLALLVEDDVTFDKLYNIATSVEDKILKSVSLFDVYQGDKLPKNKKSYALSFVFQDQKKTLTDAQVEKIMKDLEEAFKKQANAQLR